MAGLHLLWAVNPIGMTPFSSGSRSMLLGNLSTLHMTGWVPCSIASSLERAVVFKSTSPSAVTILEASNWRPVPRCHLLLQVPACATEGHLQGSSQHASGRGTGCVWTGPADEQRWWQQQRGFSASQGGCADIPGGGGAPAGVLGLCGLRCVAALQFRGPPLTRHSPLD